MEDLQKEILKSILVNALKQIRLDAQITQADLASRLKRPQSFISKYESGERKLEITELYSVCLALNTNLTRFSQIFEELITNEEHLKK